jgi:hypothetical protein
MGVRERNGAQRERTPKLVRLQKALRPKPCDWVYDWQTLPPEYPAGHRKAYRRIAQMHHSHRYPQSGSTADPQGRNIIRFYRHNTNEPEPGQGTTVPWNWHVGNRGNLVNQETGESFRQLSPAITEGCDQCAATGSSVARPAGGTTTVDRLPSAVSF